MKRDSRVTEWVLLTGDRVFVAAVVLFAILVFVAGLLWLDVVAVVDGGALTRSFSALVGGNLTLITIVISVNQLVVSREFGTPAELQDRIEEMMAYRHEAEDTADVPVSPVTPYDFLNFLFRATRKHALTLQEVTAEAEAAEAETGDRPLRSDVGEFVETILDQTALATESSAESPTEALPALLTILEMDFTGDLYEARRLGEIYGDSLPADATVALAELIQLFEYIGVLRQYLETLYLQRELALFSRRLFYVGIPAVAVSFLTNWLYGYQQGMVVDGLALQVVVTLAAVIAFAPLSFFFAYILRVATITRRTAALMPFKAQERGLR